MKLAGIDVKPCVRVMYVQGKPLFIMRTRHGTYTSFTWGRLAHKLRRRHLTVEFNGKGQTLFTRLESSPPLRLVSTTLLAPMLFNGKAPERCAANRDGECCHPGCPQRRDCEPWATGRNCPIPDFELA